MWRGVPGPTWSPRISKLTCRWAGRKVPLESLLFQLCNDSFHVLILPTVFERFETQCSDIFLWEGSLFCRLTALGGPRVARGITRVRRGVIPSALCRLKAPFQRISTVPHMLGSFCTYIGSNGVPLKSTGPQKKWVRHRFSWVAAT